MIIQHTNNKEYILFIPDTLKERSILDSMPGLLKQGLNFFVPNQQNIVQNLYTRINRKGIKDIKYSKEVLGMISSGITFKELPEDFYFHTEPLKHQLIALRFAYTFRRFGLLLEPGLGKTKIILDFIMMIGATRSLIICPKSLRFVWEDEALKHRPELSVYVIKSTCWEDEVEQIKNAAVVVVNYDKAVSLQSHLESLKFDFIGVDEGLIKNPSTNRTKAITKLSKSIPNRSIMSGTLVNNSPLDVFAPIRMLEPSLVGEAFGKFKNEYCITSRKNQFIVVGYKNVPEVKSILSSCSIVMRKEEWLKSLPTKSFKHIYVQMGETQKDYYYKLAHNYLLILDEIEAEVEVDNPLSVLIKLTQISNGFLYYKDNESETLQELYGEDARPKKKAGRKTYYFKEQPKAAALLSLISSTEFNEHLGQKIDNSAGEQRKEKCSLQESDGSDGRDPSSISEANVLGGERCSNKPGFHTGHLGSNCGRNPPRAGGAGDTLLADQGRRAVIWFNMAAELEIIKSALDSANHTYLVISGGDKTIGEKIRSFNNDPTIRFLVCQAKTINYGVTIMGSEKEDDGSDESSEDQVIPEFDSIISDEIFYSLNFSLEVFLQQQDRIHRIGQKRACKYWLLLTNSPVERRIADRLEEKLICNKEILVDILKDLDLKEQLD